MRNSIGNKGFCSMGITLILIVLSGIILNGLCYSYTVANRNVQTSLRKMGQEFYDTEMVALHALALQREGEACPPENQDANGHCTIPQSSTPTEASVLGRIPQMRFWSSRANEVCANRPGFSGKICLQQPN